MGKSISVKELISYNVFHIEFDVTVIDLFFFFMNVTFLFES